MRARRRIGCAVGIVLLLAGCPVGQAPSGGGGPSNGPGAGVGATGATGQTGGVGGAAWAPDEFTFDVDWDENATVVGQDDLDLLTTSDAETGTYTFDADGVAAKGLDLSPGRVLVIYGSAMRKITSARQEAGAWVVETEHAALTEAIRNGTIAWDYGVQFTPERVQAVEVNGKSVAVKDGGPIEFEITQGDFTYNIKATLETERSNVTFTVTKNLAGTAKANFVVDGWISRFRSRDRIDLADNKVTSFNHQLDGMNGELTLELIVTASGRDVVNLELPVPVMKIGFLIGPIPVVLNLKVQFVINASVPIDGSSWVKAKFTYDSSLGLRYGGTEVGSAGHLGSHSMDRDRAETASSSAIAANFGVGFPRIELNIAADSVVPWAQMAFLIGGSFAPAEGSPIPVCQTADALILGAAGYNLGLFGLPVYADSVEFFRDETELLRAGDCPEK